MPATSGPTMMPNLAVLAGSRSARDRQEIREIEYPRVRGRLARRCYTDRVRYILRAIQT